MVVLLLRTGLLHEQLLLVLLVAEPPSPLPAPMLLLLLLLLLLQLWRLLLGGVVTGPFPPLAWG